MQSFHCPGLQPQDKFIQSQNKTETEYINQPIDNSGYKNSLVKEQESREPPQTSDALTDNLQKRGIKLGQYLGGGAFGRVYKALKEDKSVAVKILKPASSTIGHFAFDAINEVCLMR